MAVLSKKAPAVNVFIGRRPIPIAHVLGINLTSGGRTLPSATIIIQPTNRGRGRGTVANGRVTDFEQAEVEIVIQGARPYVVHWGKILANQSRIDPSGDSVTLVSRIDPHHFGSPLQHAHFWQPHIRRVIDTDLPAVFNPDFDGKSAKNMSAATFRGTRVFLHPESTQTAAAIAWNQAGTPGYWNLVEAVNYLCRSLNENETFVANPTRRELAAVLPDDDSLVRNHECRLGAYLPEQLDDLLEPFGFSWTIDYLSRENRKIRVFKRGSGQRVALKLQSAGSIVDMNNSNLEQLNVDVEVADRAFNQVRVLGDYRLFEATFSLVPAWHRRYDDRNPTDLLKNAEAWATIPELERVWRDWVLNEAGDYINNGRGLARAFRFENLFREPWVARRRKFEPCLTLNQDGSPKGHVAGVYVEWFDRNGDGRWHPVDELGTEGRSVRVLERECGIRFDGLEIPGEIRAQGQDAQIRVTASIRSDQKLQAIRDSRTPMLLDRKTEVIDVGSRLKYRERNRENRFRGVAAADEADDLLKANALGDQLLDAWDTASVNGTAVITGIDYDYTGLIGSALEGIDGRNVGFRTKRGRDPRFPTIMAVQIRPQEQTIELSLDTSRGDLDYFDKHIDAQHGKRRRVR